LFCFVLKDLESRPKYDKEYTESYKTLQAMIEQNDGQEKYRLLIFFIQETFNIKADMINHLFCRSFNKYKKMNQLLYKNLVFIFETNSRKKQPNH
jgi:hypothetical protein